MDFEVLIPGSANFTLTALLFALVAFLSLVATATSGYFKLTNQVTTLEKKMDLMRARNVHADLETQAVKDEQSAQRTCIAVMAEQIGGITRTLDRIDRNVERIVGGTHQ